MRVDARVLHAGAGVLGAGGVQAHPGGAGRATVLGGARGHRGRCAASERGDGDRAAPEGRERRGARARGERKEPGRDRGAGREVGPEAGRGVEDRAGRYAGRAGGSEIPGASNAGLAGAHGAAGAGAVRAARHRERRDAGEAGANASADAAPGAFWRTPISTRFVPRSSSTSTRSPLGSRSECTVDSKRTVRGGAGGGPWHADSAQATAPATQ
jgi:hypothetical protein